MLNGRIAIILVNYNGIDYTRECIISIKKTTNYHNCKIIVVDNCSYNDELSLIKKEFSDIVGIQNIHNEGFADGNNIGIKYALENQYEFIMLLNNDTIISKSMISMLQNHCSDCSIVAPKIYYYKSNDVWYGGGDINRFTGNSVHLFNEYSYNNSIDCSFASGCCFMAKATVFKEIGLLDTDYFMYYEDADFCIRLIKNGIGIKYIPGAKMWHKVGRASGGSNSSFSTYYLTRNRLNYIKKNRNYFFWTAYYFSIISRVYRMFTSKDKAVKKAFKKGIVDHFKGISGKSEL